jgi:hypothetical protein
MAGGGKRGAAAGLLAAATAAGGGAGTGTGREAVADGVAVTEGVDAARAEGAAEAGTAA